MCGKNDCPYLHKKVTAKTDICIDFLKGYCERAAQVFDTSKKHVWQLNSLLNDSSVESGMSFCVPNLKRTANAK